MSIFKQQDYEYSKGLIVKCLCNSPNHNIEFIWFPRYKEQPPEKEVYITYHLKQKSIIKRIITALKYIFKKDSKYGDYEEVILNEKDLDDLINNLQEIKKDLNE